LFKFLFALLLIVLNVGIAIPASADSTFADSKHFRDATALGWKRNESTASRWKTMIGGSDGGQINDKDIRFGLFELAPKAIYHGHRHDSPEIYYITSGKAMWTVGDEAQMVSAGMTIHIPSGTVHKMVNLGEEAVGALWIWWAPNGEREIFDGEYKFVEETPVQPVGSGFEGEAATRSH
jgi:quercetin dioxygenase-like cupin family protein